MTTALDRFARVHGSGIFFIDDFCALTGFNQDEVAPLLQQVEQSSGRVLSLSEGMYILKPKTIVRKKKLWYDWKFNPSLQRKIFEACRCKWQTWLEIQALTGLKETTLKRYLRAMERTGNLISKRSHIIKLYSAEQWSPLSSYQQHLPGGRI